MEHGTKCANSMSSKWKEEAVRKMEEHHYIERQRGLNWFKRAIGRKRIEAALTSFVLVGLKFLLILKVC